MSKTSGKNSAMIKIPRRAEDRRRISQNKDSLVQCVFAVYFADLIRINGCVSRFNPKLVRRISDKWQCRGRSDQKKNSNSAGRGISDATETAPAKGISVHRVVPSLIFLPALPWHDGFHYVTSRVPAYKEVKDVWKCVRYCVLSSLGIPCDSHARFPLRAATPVIDCSRESIRRAATLARVPIRTWWRRRSSKSDRWNLWINLRREFREISDEARWITHNRRYQKRNGIFYRHWWTLDIEHLDNKMPRLCHRIINCEILFLQFAFSSSSSFAFYLADNLFVQRTASENRIREPCLFSFISWRGSYCCNAICLRRRTQRYRSFFF